MDYFKESKLAKASGIFQSLNDLYNKIEGGTCKACVRCCSESVNMGYVEFLNVLYHCYGENATDSKRFPQKAILSYYLKELVAPMKCPFLNEDRTCEIYAYRPLPCRLFGNTKRKDYEANLEAIKKQNYRFAKEMDAYYHLKMPKRVLQREIPFCEDYEPKKQLSQGEVQALYDQLLHLDAKLTFEVALEGHRHNENLVGWFIEWLCEGYPELREMLSNERIEVLRAFNKKE